MDELNLLYAKLTTRQRTNFKGYLGLFFKGDPKEDKSLKLLKLMERHPEITLQEAGKKLYQDPLSKAMLMLRNRTYERLTEFLTSSLHSGLGKYDKEMPYPHDIMAFRKHMLSAQVMFSMGLSGLGVSHMKHAWDLARDCCAPELEVDVLLRLRGNFRKNDAYYQEVDDALNRARQALELDNQTIGVYHGYLREFMERSGSSAAKEAYLDRHLPVLEDALTRISSPRAEYYFHLLRCHAGVVSGGFEQAHGAATSAGELLDRYKGLRIRQRMAEPQVQLGNLNLHFGRFEEAAVAFQRAREHTPADSMSGISIVIGLIYALIYKGDLGQARTELEGLESLQSYSQFQEQYTILGMAEYLVACMEYLGGDASSAWQRLQGITQLYADKDGWGTGLRIFELILLVELGEVEWAESRSESLRKHMGSHQLEGREVAIVKLLRRMARDFFHAQPDEEALALLTEVESHEWVPFGHEVIRVDHWFRKHYRL